VKRLGWDTWMQIYEYQEISNVSETISERLENIQLTFRSKRSINARKTFRHYSDT